MNFKTLSNPYTFIMQLLKLKLRGALQQHDLLPHLLHDRIDDPLAFPPVFPGHQKNPGRAKDYNTVESGVERGLVNLLSLLSLGR